MNKSVRVNRITGVVVVSAALALTTLSSCSSSSQSSQDPSAATSPAALSSREAVVGTRNVRICITKGSGVVGGVTVTPLLGSKGPTATLESDAVEATCIESDNKSFIGNAGMIVAFGDRKFSFAGLNGGLQRPDLFLCEASTPNYVGDATCPGELLDTKTFSKGATETLSWRTHQFKATRLPDSADNIEFSVVIVA